MDKILLTAFLSALAGFITAVISIVKLVNEKESKTTDYRQAWTDSVRKAFADLIANIDSQASRLIATAGVKDKLNRMDLPDDHESIISNKIWDHEDKFLITHKTALYDTKKKIYESYALVRLHFKPNDSNFSLIEKKFAVLEGLLTSLSLENSQLEQATIREKIHAGTNEITGYARDILKTEWETVKRGEPAFQRTKKWSIGSSVAMFIILFLIGVYAGITIWKDRIVTSEAYKSNNEFSRPPHLDLQPPPKKAET